MNLKDISTQMMFTTVPIWTETSSGQTSGTAFVYNHPVSGVEGQFVPLLVTNHHVVHGARRAIVELIAREGDGPSKSGRVRAELGADSLLKYADEALDIALVPLGPLLNKLQGSSTPVFYRSVGAQLVPSDATIDDLSALEEIVFIGYPSGLRDTHSGMPIMRRGITATPVWTDFEDKPTFLIDAGVFPGSSGSPVSILNQGTYATRHGVTVGTRVLFLGVVTQTLLRREPANVYLGLGKVVRSNVVRRFVESTVPLMQASSKHD